MWGTVMRETIGDVIFFMYFICIVCRPILLSAANGVINDYDNLAAL